MCHFCLFCPIFRRTIIFLERYFYVQISECWWYIHTLKAATHETDRWMDRHGLINPSTKTFHWTFQNIRCFLWKFCLKKKSCNSRITVWEILNFSHISKYCFYFKDLLKKRNLKSSLWEDLYERIPKKTISISS